MIFISETWLQRKEERREWERIRRKMRKEIVWEMQEAGKKNKKGRPMGSMIVGTKERVERKEEVRDGKK